MTKLFKGRKNKYTSRWVVLLIDLSITMQAFFLAYLIRFNFKLNFESQDVISQLPFVFTLALFSFLAVGSYKGIVRHTGIKDAISVFWATTLLMGLILLSTLGVRYFDLFQEYDVPLGIIFIHYLLNIVLLISSRFIFKYLFNKVISSYKPPKNILIYGAGDSGLLTYTTMQNANQNNYRIIGFLDDSKAKVGKQFNRIKIYDPEKITPEFIKRNNIQEIIFSIQNIKPFVLFDKVDRMAQLPVKVKIVPPVQQWIDGHLNLAQISDVKIEDLLERSPIKINNPIVQKDLQNKVVLITGAAGSIGSEIAWQVSKYGYKQLILLDQSESALYDLQQDFKRSGIDHFSVELADIRNEHRMLEIFRKYEIDVIFHAAAYKHVPLMEDNPYEAVKVNVVGTSILMKLATKHNVDKFVMISTDKAVNPTNVMGATKRVAEIHANYLNGLGKTKFVTTRFGNVLGSNGSVIPLFKKQLDMGGPLTVTHPEITRFFMTIPEACQLVLEAGAMGNGGEIYVFDMGESVKIVDLAKKMINLSGLRYPEDIDITFTGLRPGEKLYEELLATEENTIPTYHEKILIAKTQKVDFEKAKQAIDKLMKVELLETLEIVVILKELVPNFVSNNSQFESLDKQKVKVKSLKIS
ncbi:polysaccharide biosynthesis protein [Namhaeicola litoreus]|uniref:Polysaccharide biosynthesis protein n=1 Tax=Namhaeicola litoreus TaxID=1052145 RepID=A0ABW3Y5A9_9FLAO